MRKFINIMESILDEASPSRIASHIKKGTPFFAISACRADLPVAVNKKRTKILRDNLAKLPGVSFVDTEGEYQEVGQDKPSKEDSFFVMPRSEKTNMEKFHNVGKKLMDAFGQDSILIGNGKDVSLYFSDGTSEVIGDTATFRPEIISQLGGFSKVNGRSFSFTNRDNAETGVGYGNQKSLAS